MRLNYLGTYEVIRALVPTLARNKGIVVHVLSQFALTNAQNASGYAASKVALRYMTESLHYMTESLQPLLAAEAIQLFVAYPGGIDTDTLAQYPGPESSAPFLAEHILNAVADGGHRMFPRP